MNILFTLCGRAGSKGVKGKNTKEFLERPLVWWSMACIALYKEKYTNCTDRIDVVLNTDSDDLIYLVQRIKTLNVTVLKREKNLAGDKVPKVSVISDCLARSEKLFGVVYDIVIDLDITSPLRTVDDVKNAIDKKIARPEIDVVYSVTHARRNPYFNMVKEVNGEFCKAILSNFTMRQEAPVFYDMNASIYAYSPQALKEKAPTIFFNDHCDAILMFDTGILDIDSEEDFELMQVIAKYLFDKKAVYKEIFNKVNSWV